MGSNRSEINDLKLVFVAFLLSKQHYKWRTTTSVLEVRNMCPSRWHVNLYTFVLSELRRSNSNSGLAKYKWISSSSHPSTTSYRHDMIGNCHLALNNNHSFFYISIVTCNHGSLIVRNVQFVSKPWLLI